MAEIYTTQWYDNLKDLLNSSESIAAQAPADKWRVSLELMGDGQSPYIPAGQGKYFLALFDKGKCQQYEELAQPMDGKDLDFRLTGPAAVFEEIAAGQRDFIEAGLRGTIKIRGDMRVFMQNAELVRAVAELYSEQIDTQWPKGKPPYD